MAKTGITITLHHPKLTNPSKIVVVAREYMDKSGCKASVTRDGRDIGQFEAKTMDSLIQSIIRTFYSKYSDCDRAFEIHII